MKEFRVRHEVNCTPGEFWDKIHFGGFNRAMYTMLEFGYQVIEDDPASGVRKTHITPVVDAPKVLVKALGESVSFEEHGQLVRGGDASGNRYEFKVLPGVFPTKIHIGGAMFIEPNGSSKSWRNVDFKVGCTIFGIGGVFEHFVSKEIQKTYDESAKYTNDFLEGKFGK